MKTEYKAAFIKDLKALKSTPSFQAIAKIVFEEIPNVEKLSQVRNLKQLKGDENTFRIRVGDYRIGFCLGGETIVFKRVLHRQEIYRYFP
jgi:mRNA-degrading endonuclease RelE of RelBE toxin-antitoxin system